MWLAWAACAGAVMSKGLAGLVLPGGAIFFYLLASRDWKFLGRLHLLSGVAIVLALCAPWFVAVSIANPEFPDFFFVREHFQRYLTTVHRRTEPWWYFLPLLVAGTLPWTPLALRSVWRPWRDDPAGARFRPRLFLACWCAFVLLFFSASSSKLPSYILPIFPAVAWLIGDRLDRTASRTLAWTAAAMVPLAIAAGVIGLNADRWATKQTPVALYQAFEPWIVAAAASILAGSLAAMWLARRERVTAAVASLSIAGLVAWQLAITGHDALSPSFSSYQLASQVRGSSARNARSTASGRTSRRCRSTSAARRRSWNSRTRWPSDSNANRSSPCAGSTTSSRSGRPRRAPTRCSNRRSTTSSSPAACAWTSWPATPAASSPANPPPRPAHDPCRLRPRDRGRTAQRRRATAAESGDHGRRTLHVHRRERPADRTEASRSSRTSWAASRATS
jgi:hypothetical protein